jgi:CDP-diacylglycerol--serine O-phosphatidyltransferase
VKGNLPKLLLVVLAVVAAIFLRWLAVPVVFVFYIIVSLAFQDGPQARRKLK